MNETAPSGRLRRRRALELDLPPLTGWEALTLSYVLDQLDTLIWLRHGSEMSALLACGESPANGRPDEEPGDDEETADEPAEPDDSDF